MAHGRWRLAVSRLDRLMGRNPPTNVRARTRARRLRPGAGVGVGRKNAERDRRIGRKKFGQSPPNLRRLRFETLLRRNMSTGRKSLHRNGRWPGRPGFAHSVIRVSRWLKTGVLTPEGGCPYKPPIDDALPPPTGRNDSASLTLLTTSLT